MLGRQDAENIYVMFSDHLHFWDTMQLILEPKFPWEFVQLGNCGSPIETEAGWLVISHGVGPMRKYCIGAFLLDPDDPTKVIGRLPEPLIKPNPDERDGYVPNVVYSCGSLVHNGQLVIPYATPPRSRRCRSSRSWRRWNREDCKICTFGGRTCIRCVALDVLPEPVVLSPLRFEDGANRAVAKQWQRASEAERGRRNETSHRGRVGLYNDTAGGR
jgi:hypothetical protein